MRETFVIKQDDITGLAEKVVELLERDSSQRAKVIHLGGDLGAGKTTFTKELAHVIGIDREDVNSPTFILKKEYRASHPVFQKLIHIDAYRFAVPEEEKVLKLNNDLERAGTIIAIEWPKKMNPMRTDVDIHFNVIDDDTREVSLSYDHQ